MRKYLINAESYQEILEAEKATKSKKVSKKLSILLTRFGGKTISKTAKQMNCSESRVKRNVAEYMQSGLQEFIKPKQKEKSQKSHYRRRKSVAFPLRGDGFRRKNCGSKGDKAGF